MKFLVLKTLPNSITSFFVDYYLEAEKEILGCSGILGYPSETIRHTGISKSTSTSSEPLYVSYDFVYNLEFFCETKEFAKDCLLRDVERLCTFVNVERDELRISFCNSDNDVIGDDITEATINDFLSNKGYFSILTPGSNSVQLTINCYDNADMGGICYKLGLSISTWYTY